MKVSEGFGHGIGMSQRLRWDDMVWEKKKEQGRIAYIDVLVKYFWKYSFRLKDYYKYLSSWVGRWLVDLLYLWTKDSVMVGFGKVK